MKIEYSPARKASDTISRGNPPLFILELSRTETMDLIWKLAKSLVPFSVNRYTVEPGTQPEMRYKLTGQDAKVEFGELIFSVNIKEGYLSGDIKPEE